LERDIWRKEQFFLNFGATFLVGEEEKENFSINQNNHFSANNEF